LELKKGDDLFLNYQLLTQRKERGNPLAKLSCGNEKASFSRRIYKPFEYFLKKANNISSGIPPVWNMATLGERVLWREALLMRRFQDSVGHYRFHETVFKFPDSKYFG
jgi:hypothetical protein